MVAEAAIGGYILSKADMLLDESIKDNFKLLMSTLLKEKWTHKSKKGNELISKILIEDEIYSGFIKSHIMECLFIKTIDGKNKNVFVDDIYIETQIELIDDNTSLNSKKIIELARTEALNIEGIAGQGKSTFLRRLMLDCIKLRTHLPIFIELRKLKDEQSIISAVVSVLRVAGLDADIENTQSALMSKKLLLLLDGYDELRNEDRERIYNEIEELKLKFKTPLIITSRPDTAICNSTLVKGLRIKNLSRSMALDIIKKRMDEEHYTKAKEILEVNERLFDSLITPILVSLFCASYPETDFIPKTASDYYSRIFNILYEGHDKRKLFYNREKKLNLPTDLAKKAFMALCFLCFSASKLSLSKEEVLHEIYMSLKSIGKENNLDDRECFLEDLVSVTGLINSDGFENYSFIHRSIMEYHASVYIKNSEKKSTYQNKICSELLKYNDEFFGLTEFLYEIDHESTLKNITIPIFERFGFDANHEVSSEQLDMIYNSIIGEARIGMIFYGERTHHKDNKKIQESLFINKVDQFNDISFVFNIFIDDSSQKIKSFNDITQNTIFNTPTKRTYISTHAKKVKNHEVEFSNDNSTSLPNLISDMNLTEDLKTAFSKEVLKIKKLHNILVDKLKVMSDSESYFSL
ncbi:NACHT domain-containing protein [Kosakonia cowanii]|uniref:NACHT domain-containing protein n=1 Tax=Kosakonia cowanii TaxID=208223 RepID=UPI0023F6E741|nr:NACHT domain-containing protein [Kosakonia cowanii]MDF7758923.1 NACHT domain-containing protein [Kosakonia cowanii]